MSNAEGFNLEIIYTQTTKANSVDYVIHIYFAYATIILKEKEVIDMRAREHGDGSRESSWT